MNLIIFCSPAGGYGDIVFCLKLAMHQAKVERRWERVYLVNWKDFDDDTGRKECGFFQDAVKGDDKVHYLSRNKFITSIKGHNIKVDFLFIGPSCYDFPFLGEGLTSGEFKLIEQSTPVIICDEYNILKDSLDTYQNFKKVGFNNLVRIKSGLPDMSNSNNAGIFIDRYSDQLSEEEHQSDIVQQVLGGKTVNDFKSTTNLSVSYKSPRIDKFDLFCLFYKRYIQILCQGKEVKLLILGDSLSEEHKKILSEHELLNEITILPIEEGLSLGVTRAIYTLANGLGYCHGDQSLSDTISAGLIPIYDILTHKSGVMSSLKFHFEGDSVVPVTSFFYTASSEKIGKLTKQLETISDNDFKQEVQCISGLIQELSEDSNYNLYRQIDGRIVRMLSEVVLSDGSEESSSSESDDSEEVKDSIQVGVTDYCDDESSYGLDRLFGVSSEPDRSEEAEDKSTTIVLTGKCSPCCTRY